MSSATPSINIQKHLAYLETKGELDEEELEVLLTLISHDQERNPMNYSGQGSKTLISPKRIDQLREILRQSKSTK